MNKIVYDRALIQVMALFESVTHAELKDCVKTEYGFLFVVPPHEVGKAVGAQGKHVRRLEKALNARVKIVEFSEDPVTFIKHLMYPLQALSVSSENGMLMIAAQDGKTRSLLIGRNASTLRSMEAVVKRYFPINEVMVK